MAGHWAAWWVTQTAALWDRQMVVQRVSRMAETRAGSWAGPKVQMKAGCWADHWAIPRADL